MKAKIFALTGACIVSFVDASVTLAQEATTMDHEDEHHELEEITVFATPLERTVEQLAQPTSVLTGEQLARKQSTSIGETLSSEVGVSSTFFGPVASRPVIRGQSGERVRILANGLDSLDASALSADHQTASDSILAERIEIVRGPATLLYGSGAAGGLVNVVDSRIPDEAQQAVASGTIAAGLDSATQKRDIGAQLNLGNGALMGHVDYIYRTTDNYSIPGFAESDILRALEEAEGEVDDHDEDEEAFGRVNNTDSKTETGAVGLSWLTDNGYVGASASVFQSNYGVPGHSHHEDGAAGAPGEEVVRIDLDQKRYELRSEYEFESFIDRAELRLVGTDYEHVELEGGEVGTIFETDGFDSRLQFEHAPIGAMVGAFGFQYKRIDFNAIGDEAFVPPSDTRQTSVFLFEEWGLTDDLLLQASGRIERQTIETPASTQDYSGNAYGASIGSVWTVLDGRQRLAANLALTQRHPNSTELYANGPHIAVQRFEKGSVVLGNGILEKERSANLDLTYRGETERLEWSVTAFVNQIDDYILLSPTDDVDDGFQVWKYGQTDARLTGYEAEMRLEIADTARGHWHTRLFSDMVRGEDRRTGDNLPRIPPLRIGLGLHYAVQTVEAGIDAIWHDDQDRVARNELPTRGYTLWNAEVSYAMDAEGLFFFLRGSNLTDEDARQSSSPLKDIAPLPGRSVNAGIRYDF